MRWMRAAVIGLICVVVLAAAGAVASDAIAWRVRVVRAKIMGKLPEIPLADFVRWLAPGSPVFLGNLADNPNVVTVVDNPLTGEEFEKGSRLYGRLCASCHGDNGRGKMGPDLVSATGSKPDWIFFSAVKWGLPGTPMAAQPLEDREIWETHAYLKELAREDQSAASSAARRASVDPESIVASHKRPDQWLTFAGNYAGHRHTSLAVASKRNAKDLRVAWVAQLRSAQEFLEASPIVASGLLFVTESPEGVVALDAASGRKVWQFRRPIPSGLPLCCGIINRGVAILNERVFVATLDAHLVALDASTGRRRWDAQVADYRDGYSMTGAPLALGDRVIVGVAGGEFGIRGFVAAYGASDGKLLWKFYTIPGPGEPGHDTWSGDSWKTGGGPTWSVGAYDPDLNLLYWGVGNPAPTFRRKERAGDNLYSNSVVALDAGSGKLRWHYQFTPADDNDWDSVQQPVIADIPWKGASRRALLWANRNGFFYALDRQTGEFLFAKAFAKQTWASGFTPEGRPIPIEEKADRNGRVVWPATSGATNWWPPSYDAVRRLLYVPTVDAAATYFTSDAAVQKGKRQFLGSASVFAANLPAAAGIKAIEVSTGNVRWETRLDEGPNITHFLGGILSTDSGLVFGSYHDEFLALDSDSGRILWRVRVGARINAPPVAYAVDGTQFIALTAGNSLFAFSLPSK
jgi:alcohol dehydrogenase (cytochrome c)